MGIFLWHKQITVTNSLFDRTSSSVVLGLKFKKGKKELLSNIKINKILK